MATKLRVLKGAPETYMSEDWFQGDSNRRCISPRFYDGKPSEKCKCNQYGRIQTDRGPICIVHARSWARRGWLNAAKVRAILEERAREQARKAAQRASCLRRGVCI